MSEHFSPDTIDIAAIIDRQGIGRLQILVMALCAAALFADGFDVQVMGYVAPSLLREWHLKPGSLGPVLGAGLFGLMIGALIWSPFADRFGRKPVLVLSLLLFGFGALATPWAHSLDDLFWFRLVTGLGLGGAMPNAIALASEYAPKRLRTTLVMLTWFGFTLGSGFGGAVAAYLTGRYGWGAAFYFGGVLPLLLLPLLLLFLPESVRALAIRGGAERRVLALLARMGHRRPSGTRPIRFIASDEISAGFPVKALFTDGRAVTTLLLWVMFFMNLLNLYFLGNWMPTLIHQSGIAESVAIVATSMIHFGGMAGAVLLGLLSDRLGSYRVLTISYVFAGAFIAAIGESGDTIPLLIAGFGAGFCIAGGQICANALAANLYPTAARSTGVGWALGVGRVGSVLGPVIAGVLVAMQWSTSAIFAVAALPAIAAAAAALTLGRRAQTAR